MIPLLAIFLGSLPFAIAAVFIRVWAGDKGFQVFSLLTLAVTTSVILWLILG